MITIRAFVYLKMGFIEVEPVQFAVDPFIQLLIVALGVPYSVQIVFTSNNRVKEMQFIDHSIALKPFHSLPFKFVAPFFITRRFHHIEVSPNNPRDIL